MNTNINYQPIEKLQLFSDLINKMYQDTLAKFEHLKKVDHEQLYYENLSHLMNVMHMQMQNDVGLIAQFERWQNETSDIANKEIIAKALEVNNKISYLTNECQKLAYSKLFSTREAYYGLSSNVDTNYRPYSFTNDYNITDEQIERYQNHRVNLKILVTDFFYSLDKDSVNRCAKRLGILEGNSLLLINTEHELNVFYDYCLYQSYHNQLNVAERCFLQGKHKFDSKLLPIFTSASKAIFAYLDIIEAVNDHGVVVYDRLRKEERLLIDKGINNITKKLNCNILVSHIIDCGDFIMTTGASTPVPIHTESGLKVERLFRIFLALNENDKNNRDYKQYVTDIYKTIINEDITGEVTSPKVPHGRDALKKKVMESSFDG